MPINRVAPFLFSIIFLVGCAGPAPVKHVSEIPPPTQTVSFEGGSIKVSYQPLDLDGETAYEYHGEQESFVSGVRDYTRRYLKNWKIVDAGEALVTFQCKRVRNGWTNCAEMMHECTVTAFGEQKAFTRLLESGACMEGGNSTAYQNESRNHGLQIAKPLLEQLSSFTGLQVAAAEKALESALKQEGTKALESVVATYRNTEASVLAQRELDKRIEQARQEQLARIAEREREERLYGEFRRQYKALASRYISSPPMTADRRQACGKLSLKSPPSLPRNRRVGQYPKSSEFEQRINENVQSFGKHVQCVSDFLQNADYESYALQVEQDTLDEPLLWQAANFKKGQQKRAEIVTLEAMLDGEDAYMRELQKRFESNQAKFESEWKRQVRDEQEFARREAERRAEAAKKRRIAEEKKKCLMGLAARNALTLYSDGYCETLAKKGISGYNAAMMGSQGAGTNSGASSSSGYTTNLYEMPKFDLAGTIANAREAARTNNPAILWDESGKIRTTAAPGVNRLDGYRRDPVRSSSSDGTTSANRSYSAPTNTASSARLPKQTAGSPNNDSYRERAAKAVSSAKTQTKTPTVVSKPDSGKSGINITAGGSLSFAEKPASDVTVSTAPKPVAQESELQKLERTHGCWDGLTQNKRSCLVVINTEMKKSGQFFVTYKNTCQDRLYVKSCIEKKDGSNSCGAFGILGGRQGRFDAYEATTHHEERAIGARKGSSDWVCSELVNDWNSFDD
ncbi:hypothetical protein [uncultured Amphritea sp.]|uniref:hypothetical protein n=1 Tax=uncultured Amphritea sp. TaxID=981605 RepID=UPI00261E45CF|nr:hypothetical protein [uncultured Amphritea sp.]